MTEEYVGFKADNINIQSENTAARDINIEKYQVVETVKKTITEATHIQESLKNKLDELTVAVKNMVKEMPDDKAEEVTSDLQTLTDEALKNEPRKKWYELSGEGLIEAAKAVGLLGKPVIDTTQAIMKILS
ncbi:MAG: hypothetical protein GY749_09760 [Desulfobacteraceae bacterium]|nr:hypothetical protein [Desulfobacteraceae bacterium]